MMNSQNNSATAIRYFLRDVSDAERDSLEERLFTDDELSELFDAVENDLIDDYVRGEMNPATRAKFESAYLISERRKLKVAAAGILTSRIAEPRIKSIESEKRVSLWKKLADIFRMPRLAWAGGIATLVLLGLFAGWLLLSSNEQTPQVVIKDENDNSQIAPPLRDPEPPTRSNSSETNTERRASANVESNSKTTPNLVRKKERPKFFAFTLLPTMRSGEQPVLKIPRSAETINLLVVHDNEKEFAKYLAEIFNPNGDLVWNREIPVNPTELSRPITISVRNSTLKPGVNEMKLSGITNDGHVEEIKFYNFTVRKR